MKTRLMMMAAAVAVAFGAWAETEKVGDYTWTYRINGDTAEIYKNDYSAAISPTPTGAATIPTTLGGKPVASIGSYAFYGCSGLTSVTIPDSVTSIGDWAFYDCSGLTSVTIGDSVTCIRDYAFYGCSSLTGVTIPDSVTSIGDWAFDGCSGLTNITVNDGNTMYKSVEGLLLNKDGSILIEGVNGEVTIPDSVTRIGYLSFDGRGNLTNVRMPDSVTIIEDGAFRGCCSLTNVVLSANLKNLGGCAPEEWDDIGVFDGCSRLRNIVLPNGLESIGNRSFSDCECLTSVTIPDSVTSVGSAICCRSGITNITVSANNIMYKSVEGLLLNKHGTTLIQGVNGDVTIPDSVTSIGNGAFEDCSGLTCVTIPDSVTSVGKSAFSSCRGLTGVTIGNGVTNIGEWAFFWCSGLTSVTMKGNCPTVGSTAFSSIADGCVARLPKGNTTYDVVDGKWQGMTVEYYDLPSAPTVAIDDTKMEMPVEQDGKRVIAAKEGETITAGDVDSIKISSPIDSTDITAAYVKTLVGNQITIELATPQVGVLPEQAEEAPEDEDDATGLLVVVDESEISAKPEPKNEETVGALPVKTYPGLWYQAEWGDDIGNLTSGDKVQATGGSLYLGVIKQTGERGFYKISVSEK